MKWADATDDDIRRAFEAGGTYDSIAVEYGTTRNAVAGRCRRIGLVRPGSKQAGVKRQEKPNVIERAEDHRDIDMICDVDGGHAVADVAAHWRVERGHVEELVKAAKSG